MPHKRSRTGCLTCRDDGYKCDEGKPSCDRCIRLGKTCKGYGLRVRWKTTEALANSSKVTKKRSSRARSAALSQQSTSSSSPEPQSTGTVTPTEPYFGHASLIRNPSVSPDISPMNHFLLHHWNSSLAGVISMASGTENPFLLHLTPMTLRSNALLYSISSMAAGHLSVLRNDESLRTLASRHMIMAVSSLRESIQTEHPEISLATILMLQISDRLFNTHSQIDHLAGAKAVIMHSGGPGNWKSSTAQFLLSLCFYHDVMSSISRTSKPLLTMTNVAPLEGLESLAKLTSVLSVVATISKMQGKSGEAHQQRGFNIKQNLLAVGVSPNGNPDIENTIQACKHAAIIYLYRLWEDGTQHLKPVHAEECLRYLLKVPITSSFVSAHAWPLWTAGCESVDPQLRQLALERLEALYQNRHLPSLKRVQQDMIEVWKAKDAARLQFGTENVDCCRVILLNRRREADLV
ncbi:fungal Zn binuclear cluster domain containing protein [Colletotrichum truncatum]|uniref:Fungal Zn binuclear cluster domain containing protein n=1 Tax=Colletotrichum truncatum TaxID=5467 RepID=A0ACC3YJX3_COLTU|nr:fungal Zn binuclear cluster domain containing protein [Colletotrichum truncatum]KAF6797434.1 fungal Zn binuclear cluster domain containing protein [Colletotrichum truncatum]